MLMRTMRERKTADAKKRISRMIDESRGEQSWGVRAGFSPGAWRGKAW